MLVSNTDKNVKVYWAGKTHIIKPFGILPREVSKWDENIEQRILDLKKGKHVYREYEAVGRGAVKSLKVSLQEVHETPFTDLEMVDDETFYKNLEKKSEEEEKDEKIRKQREEEAKKAAKEKKQKELEKENEEKIEQLEQANKNK